MILLQHMATLPVDSTGHMAGQTQYMQFGTLAGIACILLVVFIGYSILIHGWPEFRRRK